MMNWQEIAVIALAAFYAIWLVADLTRPFRSAVSAACGGCASCQPADDALHNPADHSEQLLLQIDPPNHN